MKKYLILGFFLAIAATNLQDTFVLLTFQNQEYFIPIPYLFLIFTIFFVSGFILAYEWQAIKLVFKNWKIYSLKKQLISIQKNVDDYKSLTGYLKDKNDYLFITPEINCLQRQTSDSVEILLQKIQDALKIQNFNEAFKLHAKLPKKIPAAIKHMIYFDILKEKLILADPEKAIMYLEEHEEWIWNYEKFINESLQIFQDWPQNYLASFLSKIDPVKLTAESLLIIEKISIQDSVFWLNLFYDKKWHLFCHHNSGLAFLLLKMNLKNGNKLQAMELIETLPFSLAKVAIKAYVTSKVYLDSQSTFD